MTTRDATSYLPRRDDGTWPADARRSLRETAELIAIGAVQWPWLLRSLSGGSRSVKAALLERLQLPTDALPNLGSWKADTGFLTLIVDRIEAMRPQVVVELGSGASSLIVAKALALNGGGRLTSCDQHADFVSATREWLGEHGVDADMRATPLVAAPGGWPGIWYDHGRLPERIDMLVIDGPPWTIHPYVRGAAETLFDRLPVGGTVLLDDAARPGERIVAARWRKRWPDMRFDLVQAGTKGTLVGVRER
ncbi:class I SAM-dependent methyltransferase [Sphingomonas baiyangensis]|uniref:Class I SAM-dependent methyltransferase n=1 Tax=Sphingomonas baiyangensis TaxID=2572576 RepID=A0A4U1L8S4_9SPHN|nr:class I SAM-dependent methyltransferase [Sphingomonas baiyangensis]TKD52913.1 class I SAM-dependent methyltransferase [Sphingomonas baiyangensis]